MDRAAQISVVLPVFNAGDTIGRAVRSILDQTFRAIELIVVDDGSTDDSAAIVGAIDDARIRLVRCDHRGVAAAANTGTELASAPLIARMDADDWAHPPRLEKQRQLLEDHNLDVVGSQVRIVDAGGQSAASMQRYERWINDESLKGEQIAALRFVEFPLVNATILARRRYFELGFRDNSLPEDYDLLLRAAADGLRFGKVPEVLLDWTERPDRLTRTDDRYSDAAFMRCRREHLLAGPLHGVETVDLWGVGKTGKPWLRWLHGCGIAVRCSYDVSERKIDTLIHGVPVRHPDGMPPADGKPLLIAVGAALARGLIRPHVESRGYVVGGDAWFVA